MLQDGVLHHGETTGRNESPGHELGMAQPKTLLQDVQELSERSIQARDSIVMCLARGGDVDKGALLALLAAPLFEVRIRCSVGLGT